MQAKLYNRLNNGFDIANLKDDWSFMQLNDYIAPEFKTVHENACKISGGPLLQRRFVENSASKQPII